MQQKYKRGSLSLVQRVNNRIFITNESTGEEIQIQVRKIDGFQVTINICAPTNYNIVREEALGPLTLTTIQPEQRN